MTVAPVRLIARGEFLGLFRNRTALVSTVLIPVALCIALLRAQLPAQLAGPVMVVQVAMLLGLSAYVSTVSMLAARREALYLKRLRTTVASDGQIIAGVTAPFVVNAAVQVVAVAVAGVVATGTVPRPEVLTLGCLLTLTQLLALAFATAGLSRSADQAQLVASPVFIYLSGIAIWLLTQQPPAVHLVQQVVPLGGALSIVGLAYGDSSASGPGTAVLASVVWTLVFVAAGRATFRWEPRDPGPSLRWPLTGRARRPGSPTGG